MAIRRAVWERDEGRCSYVSREGRQCGTRNFLEFHHQVPWARCQEHRASSITLRCRAHNQHAAELDFGAQHMAGFRRREVFSLPALGRSWIRIQLSRALKIRPSDDRARRSGADGRHVGHQAGSGRQRNQRGRYQLSLAPRLARLGCRSSSLPGLARSRVKISVRAIAATVPSPTSERR